jgi:O-antigen ligase
MSILNASLLRKLEFASLLGLVFFLPMLEAPKNLFWFAFVLLWLGHCAKVGHYGGRWKLSDTVIGALWLSSFVGALFSGIHSSEWSGFGDVTRYMTLLWCVSRSDYAPKQWLQLVVVLVLASILTLGYGVWLSVGMNLRMYPELYSVGHVNHTAVYLGILCGLLLAAMLAFWSHWSWTVRGLTCSAFFLIFAGLLMGSSRGAIVAVLLIPFVLGLAWLPKSKRPLQVMIIALIGLVIIGLAGNLNVVEKQRRGLQANDPLSHRDTIWRRALVIAEIYPAFGVGMGNFGKVSDTAIAQQVAMDGNAYEEARYLGSNHAHNLYLNTLAERGWIGSSVFFGALLACLAMLLRRRPRVADNAYIWTAWGASLSGWIIIVIAGLFNTSFHHEIALLAVLPLGAWISFTQGIESS